MMEFKYDGEVVSVGVNEVIISTVNRAPDYHAGHIESVASELNKLTEIVAAMAALMTDEQQAALVEKVTYGWQPVTGGEHE